MLTADDLPEMFARGFAEQLGGCRYSRHERTPLIGFLTRKLTQHFDTIGWPETKAEAEPYVKEAINRYG